MYIVIVHCAIFIANLAQNICSMSRLKFESAFKILGRTGAEEKRGKEVR